MPTYNNIHYERLPNSPLTGMNTKNQTDQLTAEDIVETSSVSSVGPPPTKGTWYVYLLVMTVCIGGFLFGYDTGVISGALTPIQDEFHLGTREKELVVGATTFGAIWGGLFAGLLSDKFGRKLLVWVASVVFVLGAVLIAAAPNYACLLIGRLVVGLGVGIASMIVPVFIGEVAPKDIRGRLTVLNTILCTFGQVFAYLMNIAFANVYEGWRYMFGIAAVPALFQLLVMPFLPESPRHLIIAGNEDMARKVICRIYGDDVPRSFIENEIKTIRDDIMVSKSGSYSDFKKPEHYRPLIIACILQAAQQLSGFNAAMYYASTILQMAGFRSNSSSTSVAIIVTVINFAFTVIAVTIIDRVGRRRLLVITMATMILGLIALGVTFGVQQNFLTKQATCSGYTSNCARCVIDTDCGWSISQNICIPSASNPGDIFQSPSGCPARPNDRAIVGVLIASLVVYVASYALGLGYAPWLIQSEIFTTAMRGKATGISTAVNWICNLIISTSFLSMTEAMSTGGTYFFYAALSIVLWVFIYWLVPETMRLSLEEIHQGFLKQ